MRLADGAVAIRGDLPASATTDVEVPTEAGDSLDTGISRFSALVAVRQRMSQAQAGTSDWTLTVGGDCGVSLTAVENAAARHPDDVALVWFDAHPDLHTPESSPSGGFTGMALRAITGEGVEGLRLSGSGAVPLERVVLAGTRDIDAAEAEVIRARSVAILGSDDLETPEALVEAVRRTGTAHVYLHIDLDVLDPAALNGLANPLPFGIDVETLTKAITALRADFTLAGATIAGFSPSSPEHAEDDLPSILRIIGALTR